jgi:hypothetical protein
VFVSLSHSTSISLLSPRSGPFTYRGTRIGADASLGYPTESKVQPFRLIAAETSPRALNQVDGGKIMIHSECAFG